VRVYTILWTRVVLQIGSIKEPKRDVFEGLYQVDSNFLFQKHCELNGIELKKGKAALSLLGRVRNDLPLSTGPAPEGDVLPGGVTRLWIRRDHKHGTVRNVAMDRHGR